MNKKLIYTIVCALGLQVAMPAHAGMWSNFTNWFSTAIPAESRRTVGIVTASLVAAVGACYGVYSLWSKKKQQTEKANKQQANAQAGRDAKAAADARELALERAIAAANAVANANMAVDARAAADAREEALARAAKAAEDKKQAEEFIKAAQDFEEAAKKLKEEVEGLKKAVEAQAEERRKIGVSLDAAAEHLAEFKRKQAEREAREKEEAEKSLTQKALEGATAVVGVVTPHVANGLSATGSAIMNGAGTVASAALGFAGISPRPYHNADVNRLQGEVNLAVKLYDVKRDTVEKAIREGRHEDAKASLKPFEQNNVPLPYLLRMVELHSTLTQVRGVLSTRNTSDDQKHMKIVTDLLNDLSKVEGGFRQYTKQCGINFEAHWDYCGKVLKQRKAEQPVAAARA